MATERITGMTLKELKKLIAQEIERYLITWPRSHDPRSVPEILESIKRNRWTPPPGTPSTLEMLREDRDR